MTAFVLCYDTVVAVTARLLIEWFPCDNLSSNWRIL